MATEFYENLPFEDYCKIEAINASAIKVAVTPDHFRAYLAGEMKREDTPDMRLGRAIHCRLLEPEHFDQRFPTIGRCSATLMSGKNKGDQCKSTGAFVKDGECWCGLHKPDGAAMPMDYVDIDELKRVIEVAKNIKLSPANQFLKGSGYCEAVFVWDYAGLRMKTRIDRLGISDDQITIVDLKKRQVGKCDDDSVRKASYDNGYHLAALLNVAAVMSHFGKDRPIKFYLLFTEDTAPYQSNLIEADDMDLMIAKRTVEGRLSAYKACLATGKWTGYQSIPENVHQGILPSWERQRFLASEG